MKGEIDKDFYCAAGMCNIIARNTLTLIGVLPKCLTNGTFTLIGNPCERCSMRHRKWPTPEQFRKEYGVDYPEDAAVYFLEFYGGEKYALDWTVSTLSALYEIGGKFAGKIVCACTPWKKPLGDWRPE